MELHKQKNTKLAATMEGRFRDLSKYQTFENLNQILDGSLWPRDENILPTYCDAAILFAAHYYHKLLSQNGCNTAELSTEWDWLNMNIQVTGKSTLFGYLEGCFYKHSYCGGM